MNLSNTQKIVTIGFALFVLAVVILSVLDIVPKFWTLLQNDPSARSVTLSLLGCALMATILHSEWHTPVLRLVRRIVRR